MRRQRAEPRPALFHAPDGFFHEAGAELLPVHDAALHALLPVEAHFFCAGDETVKGMRGEHVSAAAVGQSHQRTKTVGQQRVAGGRAGKGVFGDVQQIDPVEVQQTGFQRAENL